MTQEDKELLIKDISARLPYGVKVQYYDNETKKLEVGTIVSCTIPIDETNQKYPTFITRRDLLIIQGNTIEDIKPYLFPLSSLTDEMLEELNANGFFKYRDTIANVSYLESKNGISEEIYTYVDIENISFLIEFFHSHHIDYRGLIPMGLAIDATGLNVY